jgi:hypothetical protein
MTTITVERITKTSLNFTNYVPLRILYALSSILVLSNAQNVADESLLRIEQPKVYMNPPNSHRLYRTGYSFFRAASFHQLISCRKTIQPSSVYVQRFEDFSVSL